MRECEYGERLMRYYDGELAPAARRRVEEHLAGCEVCRRQLARLRTTSGLLAQADAPAMSKDMLERLHAEVGSTGDLAILRICRPAALAAAALLVLCALGLWHIGAGEAAQTSPPSAWEVAAVTADSETAEANSTDAIALWMLEGLSRENGQ
jgi:anti-sigma factor RsiW